MRRLWRKISGTWRAWRRGWYYEMSHAEWLTRTNGGDDV